MHKITNANIKEWAANYDGELFDGILCDPPYELGFMGKSWDSSGIAFDTEMWADLFKLVKPGGHLLAFSGSRTYHRMAVAIEDAGFEIRDMIEWVYGSGFPKSLNIGKAVDKIQGNEREVTGTYKVPDIKGDAYGTMNDKQGGSYKNIEVNHTKGNSPYEGYGTALKPAHEPCVLARKPIEGTVANNVLKHGTGGLNIDGTRVGTEQVEQGREGRQVADSTSYHNGLQPTERTIATGRFPANLIHDGSDEVEAVFPQTGKSGVAVRRNGNNSKGIFPVSIASGSADVGFNDSGSAARFFKTCNDTQKHAIMNIWNDIDVSIANSSSTITLLIEKVTNITSALRSVPLDLDLLNHSLNALFVGEKSRSTEIDFVVKLVAIKEVPEDLVSREELKAIQDFIKSSENSTQTQSHVSTVESKDSTDITQITINCMKLCGYVLRVIDENTKQASHKNDKDQAQGTRFLYQAKASKSERNAGLEGFEDVLGGSLEGGNDKRKGDRPQLQLTKNHHPTVKPLSLTKYLATLIKPPTGGRLLVPFSGSGSEMIGALQAGWEFVQGVELTEEYIPIAEARIKYWLEQEAKKQPTLL